MRETGPIEKLLAEERAAILAGSFDDVTRIAERKQALIEGLSTAAPPAADLRHIASEISRNQTLLAAAIDGIRSVVERLAELRRARDGFDSYGPKGVRTKVGGRPPAFERKA